MKKLFMALAIAVMIATIFAVPAFAAGPTTTTVTWNGGGTVTGTVDTGDTSTQFNVSVGQGQGTFTATDANDNPYGYNVDTNSAYITGSFSQGGQMYFQTNRNNSYSSMYGPGGQEVDAFVGSSGTGAMATGSGTNYAGMTNGTYTQPHTANGYNFEATSGNSEDGGDDETGGYLIYQSIYAPDAKAGFTAMGNGSAKINDMTTGAYGSDAVNLGWGAGCYTNANAVFTGAGSFQVGASGSNSITTPIAGANGAMVAGGWTGYGDGSDESVSFNTIMNFVNGGSVGNYSISVR